MTTISKDKSFIKKVSNLNNSYFSLLIVKALPGYLHIHVDKWIPGQEQCCGGL